MKSKDLIAVMASLALASGCTERSGEDYGEEQPLPDPMASVERAGARVDIYQLTPGMLAVVATGELPDRLDGKSPVEVFEAVAAAPAPAALVETQARIAAAQRPRDHRGTEGTQIAPARAPDVSLSDSDFQAQYCGYAGADFDYCYLNRTNDYVTWFYNIHWIHSHLNAYRGTITHALWYRGFLGSWHLVDYDTTTGSSYVSTFNEGDDGDYEVSLTDATGDGYHLALHGDY